MDQKSVRLLHILGPFVVEATEDRVARLLKLGPLKMLKTSAKASQGAMQLDKASEAKTDHTIRSFWKAPRKRV